MSEQRTLRSRGVVTDQKTGSGSSRSQLSTLRALDWVNVWLIANRRAVCYLDTQYNKRSGGVGRFTGSTSPCQWKTVRDRGDAIAFALEYGARPQRVVDGRRGGVRVRRSVVRRFRCNRRCRGCTGNQRQQSVRVGMPSPGESRERRHRDGRSRSTRSDERCLQAWAERLFETVSNRR